LNLVSGCRNVRGAADTRDDGVPVRGGILKIVGGSDVDHLSTTSAYTNNSAWFLRTFTRQLVGYPASSDWQIATAIAADLAEAVPTIENRGISTDGLTYTLQLRRGVLWNTKPPREVNAHDAVRGMKMLCNPVVPTGAPGYYDSAIVGMRDYCEAFSKI